MNKDNGGAAFPHCHEDVDGAKGWSSSSGMTLRDYFAAHAPEAPSDKDLKKIFSGFPEPDYSGYFNGVPHPSIRAKDEKEGWLWLQDARIKWRWHYADAMIEARNA